MTVTAIACERPGCGGSIQDGYCDTCGLAPAKAGSRPAAPAAAGSGASARVSGRVDGSRLTTRSQQTGSTARRSRVGAGVVEIAPVTTVDPATVVMADPSVPEGRRFCTRCDTPVGRGKGGQPGRQAGFCPNCGARFDFGAKLAAGDLVAGQYEVAGALAHGGLGWIYLARDRNVSGRWCVLKGLLDTADPDAAEAAVAERRFLAEVSHPAIVDIHNFVNHDGQGYIVMEYVGGPSLKQIAKRRREAGDGPLPVTEAAAYLLAVLPALAYLHDRGVVYCDFKPDNVIHVEDSVKLIDMGGVRRLDDPDAAIFGTVGYQAPEVPHTGPTVASDLYTVGRALAVLILDWPDWQGADRERLPPRDHHDLLVDHDCLWRFLERACAPDPADRFADADEMADALHGVLCQVAAATDSRPRPRTSTRFSPPRPRLDGIGWQALPSPLLPNHPRLANRVAGVADGDPAAAVHIAGEGDLSWPDIAVVARAYCELGDTRSADAAIGRLDETGADAAGLASTIGTARSYLHGISGLAAGDAPRAAVLLADAYATAPGEAACALAYAAALTATGDASRLEEAADLYEQVAVADPSWAPAVAGLARTLTALGRQADAARVLTAVPGLHPLRAEALAEACRLMEPGPYDRQVATAAGDHLRAGRGKQRTVADAELAVALYGAALAAIERGETVGPDVGGVDASPKALARAAESALVDLADNTPDPVRRHEQLDRAARIRPWSVW
ncbi:MAG TPA: serine/threonine protein kinase [Acidimicrobiales bacterium]|nr:serine/threonine protein kinase [Acidimicrobiales bacterium]